MPGKADELSMNSYVLIARTRKPGKERDITVSIRLLSRYRCHMKGRGGRKAATSKLKFPLSQWPP